MPSYGIVERESRTFIIVNSRADELVDVLIDLKPDSTLTIGKYYEGIKRVLFNDGTPYKILHMGFTAIGGSVLMASLFNGTGTPKQNDRMAMEMAILVLGCESLIKDLPKAIENSVKVSRMGEEREYCEEICAICHDEYKHEDMIGTIICKHSFHPRCIMEWLRRKGNCPICRAMAVLVFTS